MLTLHLRARGAEGDHQLDHHAQHAVLLLDRPGRDVAAHRVGARDLRGAATVPMSPATSTVAATGIAPPVALRRVPTSLPPSGVTFLPRYLTSEDG